MPSPNLGSLGDDPSYKELVDYIYRLERKLSFLLQNLDFKNIREIDADIVRVFGDKAGVTIGELDDGSFGVEVQYGQYYLLDEVNLRQIVGQNQNMVRDHSFELMPTTGSADADQSFAVNTAVLGNAFWWNVQGSPRIRSTYNTGLRPISKYDNQSMLVNNTNYVWEQSYLRYESLTGPYTLSCYATPKGNGANTNGASIDCKLSIIALDNTFTELSRQEGTFSITSSYSSTDDFIWKRGKVVYETLPANTYALQVEVKSNNTEWIDVDGMQLVPFKNPIVYNSETSLWQHVRNLSGMWHSYMDIIGTLTLQDETQTYFTSITPGGGGGNKAIFIDAEGFTFEDGAGNIGLSVNGADRKVYAPWIQMQDTIAPVSPQEGALYFDTNYFKGHDGTSYHIIPFQASAQADSTATDVAGIVSDFNSLLAKLRASGVIAT